MHMIAIPMRIIIFPASLFMTSFYMKAARESLNYRRALIFNADY